jgi:DNA helicase IV
VVDVSRSSSVLSSDDWYYSREIKNHLESRIRKKIKDHNTQTYRSENVFLITNPERAKGLECDHALIFGDPSLDPDSPEDRKFIASGMYVAMTRARHSFSSFLPSNWKDVRIEEGVNSSG